MNANKLVAALCDRVTVSCQAPLARGRRPGTVFGFVVLDEQRNQEMEGVSMQSQISPRTLFALRKAVAVSVVLGVHFALAWPAGAALASGVYQAMPGAIVEERGDRIPNGSRVVPLSATLTFDLGAAQPSLTAVIPNAVLEGGDPFALTVRSSFGEELMDGTYRFTGDYLRELYPSGTQYGFDWTFSPASDGTVVWNGVIGWYGGHIWQVTISNITIVPQPRLAIALLGHRQAEIIWATNFIDYTLECATNLPATVWATITNSASIKGEQLSVTVDIDTAQRLFRLRKT